MAIDVNPDKNQKSFNVMLECLSCWGMAIDVNPDKNQKSFNAMLECLSCWGIVIYVVVTVTVFKYRNKIGKIFVKAVPR
jgi:hypothetical protein